MSFDSKSGVFVVIEYNDHFFSEDLNLFYRITGKNWEVSASIGGPWATTSKEKIPPGLRDKKGKSKGKAKGNGKKK